MGYCRSSFLQRSGWLGPEVPLRSTELAAVVAVPAADPGSLLLVSLSNIKGTRGIVFYVIVPHL